MRYYVAIDKLSIDISRKSLFAATPKLVIELEMDFKNYLDEKKHPLFTYITRINRPIGLILYRCNADTFFCDIFRIICIFFKIRNSYSFIVYLETSECMF